MKVSVSFLDWAVYLLLFITPHIPMPTGALGPIGPVFYFSMTILVLSSFVIFDKFPTLYFSGFAYKIIGLFSLLIISDAINCLRNGFALEIKYLIVRFISLGIFLMYTNYVLGEEKLGYYLPSKHILKVFLLSVVVLSMLLFMQATGIVDFGDISRGRVYFGINIPFKKPLGLFELSDGKLGCMMGPAFFLTLVNCFKNFRFCKIRHSGILTLFLGGVIILLQSRSGYLALMLAICFFVYLISKFWFKIIGGVAGIGLLAYGLISGLFLKIWIGLVGDGIYARNVLARSSIFMNDIAAWMRSPFIGNGNIGVRNVIGLEEGAGSHNLFSNHLAVGGLLGFVSLILIFSFYFYYAIKLFGYANRLGLGFLKGFSIWCICSMVFIIVELNFYRGLYNEYVYFMLSFGIICFLNFKALRNGSGVRIFQVENFTLVK